MIPNSKIKAFFILCTLFLVTVFTISPNLAVDTDNFDTEKISSFQQNELTFNVSDSDTLVYTINSLSFNGSSSMNVTNYDPQTDSDYDVGKLVAGTNVGYSLDYTFNNGTNDFVVGYMRGPDLHDDLQIQYYFVDVDLILAQNNGPPLIYFVIPPTNFNDIANNFTNAGYSVFQDSNHFEVSIAYYSQSSGFGKISSSTDVYNANVTVKWNKHSGIMEYYYYNYAGSNPVTLEFTFQGVTNPGAFNPAFSYQDPEMFYEISTLMIGSSNKLDFDTFNDTESHGFIEQGQYADVSLHTAMDTQNGPFFDGQLRTMTGLTSLSNPYSNETHDDGPPGMFFLLPVSSDAGWWTNISLWLTLDGYTKTGESTSSITFQRSISENTANTVTITFNKSDGILTYYNLQTVDFIQLPGTNTPGVFNLELKFNSIYDFSSMQPKFLISQGQQFKFHLDVLNFNGNTSTDSGGEGTFQQGQDINILFNHLDLTDGPIANITMSTVTGTSDSNINYDIFNQNDGPPFFIPVIPLDDQLISYDVDLFTYIIVASVTNNATVIGFTASGFSFNPDVTIDRLTINWNKATGLIINYDLEMHSTTDPNQVIKLKFHYVGGSANSSSSSSSNISTITTPGFESLFLILSFGVLVLFSRKKT